MPSVEYVGCVVFFFGALGQSSRPLGNMVLPLEEADKEARPAMPGPEGLRHVFRRSLEYVGLLEIIFWCLGAVFGASWEHDVTSRGGRQGSTSGDAGARRPAARF